MPGPYSAPVASSVPIEEGAEDNTGVGETVQEWIDNIFGPDTSQKPTYLANQELDVVTFYKGAVQTVPNRIADATITYDANLDPITEVWRLYDRSNGTTVIKTLTRTQTFVATDLTNSVLVTTTWCFKVRGGNSPHDIADVNNLGTPGKALAVDIITPGLAISTGDNLRYDEMTNNQAVAVGPAYTNIYTVATAGKVFSVYMRVDNRNTDLRITVDSTVILDGINFDELLNNYELDVGAYNQLPRFLTTANNGRIISIEFPSPALFNTEFKVELRGVGSAKQLNRGLVVRSIG